MAKKSNVVAPLITLALIIGGCIYLFYSSAGEAFEYYKHVDEVMANQQAWEGKRLQLHGHVVTNSILRKPNTLEYRFKVQNNGKVVDAAYTGIVPDTFKDEAEVMLQGQLAPDGFHVRQNGVVAKCPSKYEAASKPTFESAGKPTTAGS